jgi:hypothetical protein
MENLTVYPENDRLALGFAFRRLRSEGLRGSTLARQAFSCCGGCGVSEISGMPGVVAWVFFTKQQLDSFDRNGNIHECQQLPLVWGLGKAHRAWKDEDPDHAAAMTEWGNKIVAALKSVGLSVEWDGTESMTILVSHKSTRRMLTVYVNSEKDAAAVSGLLEAMKQSVSSLDYDTTWEEVSE